VNHAAGTLAAKRDTTTARRKRKEDRRRRLSAEEGPENLLDKDPSKKIDEEKTHLSNRQIQVTIRTPLTLHPSHLAPHNSAQLKLLS
jgi:hypothetical protein